jgi:hypothetical protein
MKTTIAIAVIATLGACSIPQYSDEHCAAYGLTPGTDDHTQCTYVGFKTARQAQVDRINAITPTYYPYYPYYAY